MWITIVVMALAISLEPFRIAMTVLMLSRPRPTLQLAAFLCGGFTMALSVGLVVLFAVRRELLVKTHLSLPRIQIGIGALALAAAAYLAVRVVVRGRGGNGDSDPATASTRAPGFLTRLLNGSSVWVAAVAGLGIALPSLDYLAVLAVILASGAAALTQFGALLTFTVVAFAPVEIPLIAYLIAPDATRAAMTGLNDWIRSRRRLEVVALLGGVGGVLLAFGISGL
jgi:Sap, sulfolipid-1-addressing protein